MANTDIDWIVEKASELLRDKVKDGPLKEEDIELAFEMFAQPRLERMSDSFSDEEEFNEAVNKVRIKLHDAAKELNKEHWPDER